MKNILMILSFFLIGISLAHAKNAVPQFKDYPVKSVYTGQTAQLDLSDEGARMFRTRLRDALKEKPDFAGEYVITMWGCGASCRMYLFVNKRTGKLLSDGLGGEERQEDIVASKANSRLLVTEEENRDENWEVKSITTRFYILDKGKLKQIKSIVEPIKAE